MKPVDVPEAQPVQGLAGRSFDPAEPVLQGLEVLPREALPAGEAVYLVDLDVAKRPVVGPTLDSAEGHSGEAVIQSLHDRCGLFAEVGAR